MLPKVLKQGKGEKVKQPSEISFRYFKYVWTHMIYNGHKAFAMNKVNNCLFNIYSQWQRVCVSKLYRERKVEN